MASAAMMASRENHMHMKRRRTSVHAVGLDEPLRPSEEQQRVITSSRPIAFFGGPAQQAEIKQNNAAINQRSQMQ